MRALLCLAGALRFERAVFTHAHRAEVEAAVKARSESCETKLAAFAVNGSIAVATLPQGVKVACAADFPQKDQCPGVTRLLSQALLTCAPERREDGVVQCGGNSSEAAADLSGPNATVTPGDACKRVQNFLVTVARDIEAVHAEYPGSPACVAEVGKLSTQEISGLLPPANFSTALSQGCTESCEEVSFVASQVLEGVGHRVSPKTYCHLHDLWLQSVGILNVNAFFSFVYKSDALADPPLEVAPTGQFPPALEASRQQNAKLFDILARQPQVPSAAAVLALLAAA